LSSQARYNLTEGPIFSKLLKLSLPIMATSLMQSAHNLTNMFWLGWLGEWYVAAAGLAGQFIWMSFSLAFMCRIGAEIGVSQSMGKKDPTSAKAYAQNAFMVAIFVGISYAALAIIFRRSLLGFFNIENQYVFEIAQQYMAIAVLSLPFMFAHFVITGVYNGFGNTKIPFYINSGALLLNIVLSPILIFVLDLGIIGAAISMTVAAAINLIVKIWAMTRYKNRPFEHYVPFVKVATDRVKQVLKWGVPVGAEQLLFALLFMLITRLISSFGEGTVAAHSVGVQIESLSFMIGGGFASAITAFIGQNYGAKKWGRLRDAYRVASLFMAVYGIIITFTLFWFAVPLVSIFLTEPESIEIGASYLRIIAMAQFLFCLEGVATGSFRGRGLTMKPTIAGVSANVLRVIICYALAATVLGTSGIWWGIAIAMTLRSVWILIWHRINVKDMPKTDEVISSEVD